MQRLSVPLQSKLLQLALDVTHLELKTLHLLLAISLLFLSTMFLVQAGILASPVLLILRTAATACIGGGGENSVSPLEKNGTLHSRPLVRQASPNRPKMLLYGHTLRHMLYSLSSPPPQSGTTHSISLRLLYAFFFRSGFILPFLFMPSREQGRRNFTKRWSSW